MAADAATNRGCIPREEAVERVDFPHIIKRGYTDGVMLLAAAEGVRVVFVESSR